MTEQAKAGKALIAGLIAAGTALWGWFGWLTILWIICMVLDYLSGSMAAMKARDWNSAKAREGLWHKTGMIVAVLAAGLGDIIIGTILRMDGLRLLPVEYTVFLCPVVMAWYSLTELGSILENAVLLGAKVPSWLTRFLQVSAKQVEHAGETISGGADSRENDKGGNTHDNSQ